MKKQYIVINWDDPKFHDWKIKDLKPMVSGLQTRTVSVDTSFGLATEILATPKRGCVRKLKAYLSQFGEVKEGNFALV